MMFFKRLALCLLLLPAALTAPVSVPAARAQSTPAPASPVPASPTPAEPASAIDDAFRNAQLAAAPGSGAALAEGAARVAAADPALRALVDASRSAEQQRRALETVLASLRAQGPSAAERARGVGADLDRAVLESAAAGRRLRAAYPRFSDLTDPEPLSLAQVQALLRPGEALVMILPSDRGTYVWALSPEDAAWFRSDLDARAVASLSATVLESVRPGEGRGAVDAARPGGRPGAGAQGPGFARETAWTLYRDLWAWAAERLQPAATVYVVVDGPLRAVPPGVLVTRAPDGRDTDPDALRATAWFARDHAFVQLPAVSSLRTVRLPVANAATGFAGFGDARTQRFPEASVGKALAPLPETRRELQGLAKLFQADRHALRLGEAATEGALKTANLEQVSVLALATHAVPADGPARPEPALVFTPPHTGEGQDDGYLTASEAAGLHLGATLVILSACDTARDDPASAAVNSLSRAFFHAGARALLVSNWRIRDDVAARLSVETIRIARRDRFSLAGAAREASLRMMADRSDPSFAHPAQWAAFSVLGDGSVRF